MNDLGNSFPIYIAHHPYMFPLIFITMWVGINYLISNLGGWRELAQHYQYQNEIISKKKYFQSAGMRWSTHYGSCLTIGGNEQGLYLSILFLFAIGSPNLFIPWHDIKIKKTRQWGLFPMLELSIAKTPSVKVTVFQSLEKFLQDIHGSPLVIEEA